MVKTYDKIDEARHFLSEMKSHYNNGRVFRFNLSAFLSSARSILWVMKAEFSIDPLFQTWFKGRKASKEEELVFRSHHRAA